ncbi:glycoside hydrolase family 16 protein [Mycena alexandri]|uniref:Glycoside hydrolase family 16 protein n=1 Tax=Mycena alexandri TaxID=1745969 RepID=A0AAD6WWE3_9AGAR|nr:glycoside hydrolase family 16 protein [Mycena alexandri]
MKGVSGVVVRLLTVSSTFSFVLGALYLRHEQVIGRGFYDAFNFEAIPDPTQGRVNYVDEATARRLNLTLATENTFILRADSTTIIDDSAALGRNSVRIRSNKAYSTHVAVLDIAHMPQGCGTWPAVWESDEAIWPNGGEVDILEGVNDQGTNHVTLHTNPGCTMPAIRKQTGTSLLLDCDVNANFNAGCGVSVTQASSYGPTFNVNGGGWYVYRYAIERTNKFISVWFWPRNARDVPLDVRVGGLIVETSLWGTPVANFPDTHCNFSEFFDANNIIINLTFCGDFAGNPSLYAASGCPSTCDSYVDANPAAFVDAYFKFNSLNVYT